MDDNSTNKRRKWTPAEKMRIVVTGMQPGVEISDLCRQEGIHATQYYTWKKQLLGSAERGFERPVTESRAARKKAEEVQRLKNVIAEITAENLEKKGALGLEDHGQLPPELQKRVHQEVELARNRSGWPAKRTLAALGVPARSYYRWLKHQAWARETTAEPSAPPVSPYEALPEEKKAVIDYARKHTHLRHCEMAWRMVDEGVAMLYLSTVYGFFARPIWSACGVVERSGSRRPPSVRRPRTSGGAPT